MSMMRPKRARRRSAEVRELLLTAAREEFLTHGYEGTTTKAIAERAGVSQTVIFNQYKNKSGLFSAALAAPFSDFVEDYVAAWESGKGSSVERINFLVDRLFDLGQEHRTILISELNRRLTEGPTDEEDIADRLASLLQSMQTLSDITEIRLYGLDPPATIAASVAMILGVVLLDDFLFPRDTPALGKDRLKAELVTLLRHGIEHRDHET